MAEKLKGFFEESFFEEKIKEIVKGKKDFPPSWKTELEKKEPTIKPTIIIGLGTSGAYCVAYIKRKIDEAYKGELEHHKTPIQYLIMDTVSWQEMLKIFPGIDKIISQDDYIFLGGFIPSEYIKYQMNNEDLLSWFPQEYIDKIPGDTIEDGARGIGLLGRLALYYHRDKVRAKIGNAVDRTVSRQEELVKEGLLSTLPANIQQSIHVYIIGGSYGGTARGIFLDMVYLCNSVIRGSGKIPRINLIIFMPRIASEYNRRYGYPFREAAIKANSYAFFKELQYFCLDGKNNIDAWRFNPSFEETIEDCRINNIFLFDTEIRGTEVATREELLNLAAEFVFNCLCAPIASTIATRRADMVAILSQTCEGKPASFSSAGISFLSYPSVSLTRITAAKMIYYICQSLLKDVLSLEEKETAKNEANRFMEALPNYLKHENIDNELQKGTENLLHRIRAEDILAASGNKTQKCWEKVENGEKIQKEGWDIIEDNFQKFKDVGYAEVEKRLKDIVTDFTYSIQYKKEVLRNIQSYLEEIKEARKERKKEKWDCLEANLCGEIEKLEKAFFVLFRGRKITNRVYRLVDAINNEIRDELAYKSYEKRKEYIESLISLVGKYINKLNFLAEVLTKIKNEMEDQIRNYKIDEEERPVQTTTQILPCSLDDEKGLERFYNSLNINVEKDAKSALSLIDKESLKKLLEQTNPEEAKKELLILLIDKVVDKLTNIFNKNVSQIVVQMLREDKETMENRWQKFISWSDPAWYTFDTRLPPGAPFFTDNKPTIAIPINSPAEIIQKLKIDEKEMVKSLDPRLIVAITEAHAAPLFIVRDIPENEYYYKKAIESYKETRETPPHIRHLWNKDLASLPEISREIIATMPSYKEAFAIALFLDWLVRIKKEEKLLNLMSPPDWEHTGPIYIEGKEATGKIYKWAKYEWREQEEKLVRSVKEGSVLTDRGRVDATTQLKEEIIKTINDFYEALRYVIKDKEIKELMEKYKEYLCERHELGSLPQESPSERRRMLKGKSPRERELKLLLCDEIDILKEKMKEE